MHPDEAFEGIRLVTPADFQKSTAVSRETLDALEAYAALLIKWQSRINLVGPRTIPDLWNRHFYDSAQLLPLIPDSAHRLVDIGTGGGFPGLVLAILTSLEVHLIESDQRKCAFLREAARVTGVSQRVTVHTKRVETVVMKEVDVVSSRALAPLTDLLSLSEGLWNPETIGLFLKGKRYKEELTALKYAWYINYDAFPSATDPESVMLKIRSAHRRDATP